MAKSIFIKLDVINYLNILHNNFPIQTS